jgi:prophage regulatory protein
MLIMKNLEPAANAASASAASKQALRLPQVLSKIGISRSHLYRMVLSGQFPKSIKLSERTVVWNEAEIDQWLENKFGGKS